MASTVELPELLNHEADLFPYRTLGGPTDEPLRRRISIGHSEALPLTPGTPGIEPDLAVWLEWDRERHRYHVIHLTCTFRPADEPITESVFAVELTQADGQPIVWSMDPLKLSTPVTHRWAISLTPTATIVPEVLGLEGGVEKSVERQKDEYHVVAAGEGESTAEWFFRATRAVELIGVHRLVLVTRSAPRTLTSMQIAFQAKVRRRFGGVIPYRAQVPEHARRVEFGGE